MGLDSIIAILQGSGCSPFFFTSAIQSTLFGEMGRHAQSEMMDSNIEFRQYLQDIRNEYSRERLDEQLLFRRESYELGRQYLIQQTIAQNESRKKQIEFKDFLHNYWPLERTPFSVLEERNDYLVRKKVIPMTVLVAKTEITNNTRDTTKYGIFCEELISELRNLPNITIEKTPWSKPSQSRIAEAMNINYIMSGIPTLIIFPYRNAETINIETASWSFERGLQSMNHSKSLQLNVSKADNVDKIVKAAVLATIGMTRDAYILAEYHMPVVYPKFVDDFVLSIPEIREQLTSHYNDISALVKSSEFIQLCSIEELQSIEGSLNSKMLTE